MTKTILTTMALAASLLTLNSCKKDKNDGPQQPANYMVVHSTPGAPAVELYLDNIKASTSPLNFGTASSYATIDPKQYNVKFAAVNSINPISETAVNLNAGGYFSIFSYDTLLNGKAKVFTTTDDLSAPPSGKAKVRFFHLSPPNQNQNIAVDILANNNKVFSSRSYADNVADANKGAFVAVDAGTYKIDINVAGSTILVKSIPDVRIEAGKIYTLLATGKLAEINAQVIINK